MKIDFGGLALEDQM